MMNRFDILLKGAVAAMALSPIVAAGMPARPGFRTMTGSDGSSVSLQLMGDEYFSYFVTTDGIPVMEDASGRFVYGRVAEGRMVSTGVAAHDPALRPVQEKEFVKSIDMQAPANATAALHRSRGAAGKARIGGFPCKGQVRGLIILAQYSDVKFSSPTAAYDFNRAMNEEGYSDYGATGSARDYFVDQSHGKFLPDFDVVGPVTLPETMEYYGANDAVAGKDPKAGDMVFDACRAASSLVDFSNYDFDNDGEVDLVFIIYAGYNEAQGGGANTIWPHQWDIKDDGKNLRINGKRIGRYACTSELRGYEGMVPDGIGTFCHEFSHCLGLPDIYDTMYSGFTGMGAWDLMDSGGYNNDSRTPAGYTAYEREAVGWMEIPVLEEAQSGITLHNILEHEEAYKIVSPYNANEYFTLENRQPIRWDSALPGHGLVISHVVYDRDIWSRNIVNSKQAGYPHLQIVPAGGQTAVMTSAAYPGPEENHEFSHFSWPASTLWSGETLHAPVTGIQETDGVVTFDFRTHLDAPLNVRVDEVEEKSISLSWDAVENADRYIVTVNSVNDGRVAGTLLADPVALSAGESYMGPLMNFSDHTTFTLQVTTKGARSSIGGMRINLLGADGKAVESKSLALRDYERTDYWVFSTDTEARLEFAAVNDAELVAAVVYNGNHENELRAGKEPEVSPYRLSVISEAVADNCIRIDGLHTGRDYVCSVKAVNDAFGSVSFPSAKVGATTLGEPNPEDIFSGVDIVADPSDGDAQVFDMQGRLLFSGNSDAIGETCLTPGIYIIRTAGSVARRVIR